MHFLQAINSDQSVLTVCNKTGGTIKGDIKKKSTYCVTECTNFNIVMIKKAVCIAATVLQNVDGCFRQHYNRVLLAAVGTLPLAV